LGSLNKYSTLKTIKMILVTGASGHLGKATIDFLLKKVPANQISALVRNEAKAAEFKEKGIAVHIGDYTDNDSMVKAFAGTDKLFLISSSDFSKEDRVAQHTNAIKAAKAAGVQHIVYTGFDRKESGHSALAALEDAHKETAAYLKTSGLGYTVLNNNLYADVLPQFLGDKVLETGVFFPAGSGKVPFATRMDMAEASATLLASDDYKENVYAFASDTVYSFDDIAKILSELSGKEVPYLNPSKETFITQMMGFGVPETAAGFMAAFGEAIANDELDTKRTVLPSLLGRKPTTLKKYLKSVYFPTEQV